MTIEVFKSELTKRGFDEQQIYELVKVAGMYSSLNDCMMNQALTAIFDTTMQTLNEIRQTASERLAQLEDEILNGYGDSQPIGITGLEEDK